MSAITEYVHYHYSNYRKYGIGRKEEDATNPYTSGDFIGVRNRILHANAQSVLEDPSFAIMQRLLYNLFSGIDSTGEAKKYYLKVREMIEKDLNAEFKNMGNINWETGNVESAISRVMKERASLLSKITKNKDQSSRYKHTIMSRIEGLNSIIDDLGSTLRKQSGSMNEASLRGKLEEIQNLYKTLEQQFPNQETVSIKATEDIVAKINNLIAVLNGSGSSGELSRQKGALFEYALQYLGLLSAIDAEYQTGKMMEDIFANNNADQFINMGMVMGDIKSAVSIPFDNMIAKSNQASNFEIPYMEFDAANNMYVNIKRDGTLNETQHKVDVELTFGGQPYFISAKNHNFRSDFDITLVSGTNLLAIFASANDEFIPHYLNVMAGSVAAAAADKYTGPEYPHESPSPILVNSAIEAAKARILESAAAGGIHQNDVADVLVVNDNTAKGIDSIKIISITKLLNNLASKELADNVSIKTVDGVDFSNFRIKNRYIPGDQDAVTARLQDIILQLRAAKLKVGLKHNFLN